MFVNLTKANLNHRWIFFQNKKQIIVHFLTSIFSWIQFGVASKRVTSKGSYISTTITTVPCFITTVPFLSINIVKFDNYR